MSEKGLVNKRYDRLYKIKEDIVRRLDIPDSERQYLEKHSNCVLCACEMTCYQCPLYKAYNTPCIRSPSPYIIIDDCITYVQLLGPDMKESKKRLLTKAYEEACKIRDLILPTTYAEPLRIP